AVPLDCITSEAVIGACDGVFKRLGVPTILLSDNGKQFVSAKFNDYCSRHQVRHCLIPRYSPSLGGKYERSHQLLHRALVSFLHDDGENGENNETGMAKDWTSLLDEVLCVINSRPLRCSTSMTSESVSPVDLMMARRVIFPIDPQLNVDLYYPGQNPSVLTPELSRGVDDHNYDAKQVARESARQDLRNRFDSIWEDMRERSRSEQIRAAAGRSPQLISEGDWVFIPRPKRHKLDLQWRGPFRVRSVEGVRVSVSAGDQVIVDSIHNVLKVNFQVLPKWCSTKGTPRGSFKPGTLLWFGDAEAGVVIESCGQEALLHMVKIRRQFGHDFEVKSLYFDEKSGSIWAYPCDRSGSPSAGEGIPSDRKPLLRSRSFDPRGKGKDWMVLNIKSKN
ncbi:hypothetical protein FOL47_003508, partial [Perkinsus chesapeaki]